MTFLIWNMPFRCEICLFCPEIYNALIFAPKCKFHIFGWNELLLQFGFTAGLSPQMATLCLTELACSSKAEKKQLILTTIDAPKAFDLVDRDILLWELYKSGVPLHIWKVIYHLYSENTCQVIWNGRTSKQGSCVFSTSCGGHKLGYLLLFGDWFCRNTIKLF